MLSFRIAPRVTILKNAAQHGCQASEKPQRTSCLAILTGRTDFDFAPESRCRGVPVVPGHDRRRASRLERWVDRGKFCRQS
jgi:hypothetical protein